MPYKLFPRLSLNKTAQLEEDEKFTANMKDIAMKANAIGCALPFKFESRRLFGLLEIKVFTPASSYLSRWLIYPIITINEVTSSDKRRKWICTYLFIFERPVISWNRTIPNKFQ